MGVNRKERQKERCHKDEPGKSVDVLQPDVVQPDQMEHESSDMVGDDQPAEEENIYISDQEEDKREFSAFS